MKTHIAVLLSSALIGSFALAAEVHDFRIKAGTGNGSWNTQSQMVNARVGDTIRIHNDDTANHQLHTNGAPCGHGSLIPPGRSWDCKVTREYDHERQGMIYDHLYGPLAEFWVSAKK